MEYQANVQGIPHQNATNKLANRTLLLRSQYPPITCTTTIIGIPGLLQNQPNDTSPDSPRRARSNAFTLIFLPLFLIELFRFKAPPIKSVTPIGKDDTFLENDANDV